MSDEEKPAIELGEPTDVVVDPEDVEAAADAADAPADGSTTSTEHDPAGGTGGQNAGGAG